MNVELKRATLVNLDELLILVRAYHDFERIEHTDESRRAALLPGQVSSDVVLFIGRRLLE